MSSVHSIVAWKGVKVLDVNEEDDDDDWECLLS